MGDKAEATGTKFAESALKVVTGASGLATSGFALYKLWDSIEDKQVSMDRANRTMESSQNNLTKAQRAYNRAVEEYGEDSLQATSAALSLENAQRNLENASAPSRLRRRSTTRRPRPI